ncbi:septation protein SpoVG family protein [Lachnospiraceae bacterium LCP25S3_G4]
MYVEAHMKMAEKDNMVAFGEVAINNCFRIKNVKLMKNTNGELFVSMPRYKGKEDDWNDLVYPKTKEAKEELTKAIVESLKLEILKDVNLPHIEVKISICEKDNLKGLATLTIDDFVIKNVRIMDSSNGLFVSMPQYKSIDKETGKEEYRDIVYPTSAAMRTKVGEKVLEAYQNELKNKRELGIHKPAKSNEHVCR